MGDMLGIEGIAATDHRRQSRLHRLMLSSSKLNFLLFLFERMRNPLLRRFASRLFVLLEIALLHRLFGLSAAGHFSAVLFLDLLVLDVVRVMTTASQFELDSLSTLKSKRRYLSTAIFSVLIASSILASLLVAGVLGSGIFPALRPLILSLLLVTPLRSVTSALAQCGSSCLAYRPSLQLQMISRILPALSVLLLAPILGEAAFLPAFVVSRLIPDLWILKQNVNLLQGLRLSSFRARMWNDSRAVSSFLLLLPFVVLQFTVVLLIMHRRPTDILVYVALYHLLSLTLLCQTLVNYLPARVFSAFDALETVELFAALMRRWAVFGLALMLAPLFVFLIVVSAAFPIIALASPKLIPLLLPLTFLHIAFGLYRFCIAKELGRRTSPLRWKTHAALFMLFGTAFGSTALSTYEFSIQLILLVEAAALCCVSLCLSFVRSRISSRGELNTARFAARRAKFLLIPRAHVIKAGNLDSFLDSVNRDFDSSSCALKLFSGLAYAESSLAGEELLRYRISLASFSAGVVPLSEFCADTLLEGLERVGVWAGRPRALKELLAAMKRLEGSGKLATLWQEAYKTSPLSCLLERVSGKRGNVTTPSSMLSSRNFEVEATEELARYLVPRTGNAPFCSIQRNRHLFVRVDRELAAVAVSAIASQRRELFDELTVAAFFFSLRQVQDRAPV